jgi:ABC-2 type transport system ATP-binding protein
MKTVAHREARDALAVERVTHAYGARVALDDVSLRVASGSFTALLGLNGAGKSTLFSVVTHLYAPRSGSVRIFDFDVARQSGAALAQLGVVFQQRTLDPDLSVAQNLAYSAALQGMGRAERRERQAELLARVGLADRARDKARHLSGGQMRRVEIARALLHSPRMLLLDEPTAGLDVNARASILALVRDLVDRDGVGALWATHLVDEIRAADHVVVLHKGRVLADDSCEGVVAAAAVRDIGAAFTKLTSERSLEDSA